MKQERIIEKRLYESIEPIDIQEAIKSRTLWQNALRTFLKNRAAFYSLWVLFAIVLFVCLAPYCRPFHYADQDYGVCSEGPNFSTGHYFGTDELGRDTLVRVAIGGRISLMIGFLAATVAVVFGSVYGATAGYLGGRIDAALMRFVEILDALPFIFFVIVLTSLFGQNLFLFFIAIGMLSWISIARVVRAQVLSLKHKAFIEAAVVSGCRDRSIIFRHLLPNVIGVVVIYASMLVGTMILSESFLSFLGLGVQEPMTSWGALLGEIANNVTKQTAWQLFFPAAFLVVTLFCLNFIGDGLRDALDPKTRS